MLHPYKSDRVGLQIHILYPYFYTDIGTLRHQNLTIFLWSLLLSMRKKKPFTCFMGRGLQNPVFFLIFAHVNEAGETVYFQGRGQKYTRPFHDEKNSLFCFKNCVFSVRKRKKIVPFFCECEKLRSTTHNLFSSSKYLYELIALLSKLKFRIWNLNFRVDQKSDAIFEFSDPRNPFFDTLFDFIILFNFALFKSEIRISEPKSVPDIKCDTILENGELPPYFDNLLNFTISVLLLNCSSLIVGLWNGVKRKIW